MADRSLIVRLVRKLTAQRTKRLRLRDGAELAVLARKIARFVIDNAERLSTIDPTPLDAANDRAIDAWDTLFAVADVAGGEWPQRARAAALAFIGADEAEALDSDVALLLLADVRDIFDGEMILDKEGAPVVDLFTREPQRTGGTDRIATKALLERLCALEERPWNAWGKAKKPMTDMGLAKLLRPYGIRSGTIRLADDVTLKGYHRHAFEDAFARYLPDSGVSSRHAATSGRKQGDSEDSQAATKEKCDGSENAGKPNDSAGCDGVTASKPEKGPQNVLGADSDVAGALVFRDDGPHPGEPAKGDDDEGKDDR